MSAAVVSHDGRPVRDATALKAEVRRWAARIGVQPKRVQVQRMTTKWASCSSAGRICLSRDLLHEDRAFQEVVIVHELLHLRVPNHGKLFRSLMTAYVPGWERRGRVGVSKCVGRAE
ncbi:MAG: M48 metallopeptidase family protein [Actinomycetota bacterium]